MKHEITLQPLTPLFIGGFDPRTSHPELESLRPPSLRGAVRFWYRAAAGVPVNVLQEQESAVFGSVDMASPVRLRSNPTGLLEKQAWGRNYIRRQLPGIAYLAFSAQARTSIQPGRGRYQIQLSQRGWDSSIMRQWLSALWLWVQLGGLGSRSRKGFGSFWPTNSTGDAPVPFIFEGNGLTQFESFLSDGTHRAIGEIRGSQQLSEPDYDILAKDVARVVVAAPKGGRQWRSWEEALDEFGKRLMQARSLLSPYMAELKTFTNRGRGAENRPPKGVDRAAFGLPISYFQPGPRGSPPTFSESLSLTSLKDGGSGGRRASPILAKVARIGERQYALVLTVFRSKFKDEKQRLVIKRKQLLGEPNLKLIDDFINGLTRDTQVMLNRRPHRLYALDVREIELP